MAVTVTVFLTWKRRPSFWQSRERGVFHQIMENLKTCRLARLREMSNSVSLWRCPGSPVLRWWLASCEMERPWILRSKVRGTEAKRQRVVNRRMWSMS